MSNWSLTQIILWVFSVLFGRHHVYFCPLPAHLPGRTEQKKNSKKSLKIHKNKSPSSKSDLITANTQIPSLRTTGGSRLLPAYQSGVTCAPASLYRPEPTSQPAFLLQVVPGSLIVAPPLSHAVPPATHTRRIYTVYIYYTIHQHFDKDIYWQYVCWSRMNEQ